MRINIKKSIFIFLVFLLFLGCNKNDKKAPPENVIIEKSNPISPSKQKEMILQKLIIGLWIQDSSIYIGNYKLSVPKIGKYKISKNGKEVTYYNQKKFIKKGDKVYSVEFLQNGKYIETFIDDASKIKESKKDVEFGNYVINVNNESTLYFIPDMGGQAYQYYRKINLLNNENLSYSMEYAEIEGKEIYFFSKIIKSNYP